MTKIKASCVLITGGASGIGRIMGRMSLERGARQLVIWDINEKSITDAVAELSAYGNVKAYKIDISDSEAVEQTYRTTCSECGDVDILINCAGIVTGNKTFDEQSIGDIERTMAINTVAPMVLALQALPSMLRRNHGHICNIASAAGMLSNPKMSVYAASKWAAIGWSDSVRVELQERRSKVRITTVAPYYITTGMFDGVRSPIIPLLKPEKAAREIIKAIERNTNFRCLMPLIPAAYHFTRLMQGLLPSPVFDWLFGRVVGIYHTMDNFTGRKNA